MSTFSPNADTNIDIGEGAASDIQTTTVALTGVEENVTDATEIKLGAEASINTETKASAVLTGEALAGTAEKPAGISLASTDTTTAQVLVVNTATVKNTVISTTAPTEPGQQVAKANIALTSDSVEAVSVKTSSTEEKSVVNLAADSADGVRVELTEAGGDVNVESKSVSNFELEADGREFAEITFGGAFETLVGGQMAVKGVGGSVAFDDGAIADSTFLFDTDNPSAVSTLNIGSNVDEVAGTEVQIPQGSAEIEVGAAVVTDMSIASTGVAPVSAAINANEIAGLVMSVDRAEADLNLSSPSTITDTTLVSSTGKGFTATLSKNKNTSITSTKGSTEATFTGKTVYPTITNDGKGETEVDFEAKTVGASLSTKKGAITASFEGKSEDIVINAKKTKKPVDLDMEKTLDGGDLTLGKAADEIVFGGKVKDSFMDLGKDRKSDSITIDKPKKVEIELTRFREEDVLILKGQEFTFEEIIDGLIDQFPGITFA